MAVQPLYNTTFMQDSYQPTEVCKGLWIVPDWCKPPEPAALNIRMAPGLAFGTGKQFCCRSPAELVMPATHTCIVACKQRGCFHCPF